MPAFSTRSTTRAGLHDEIGIYVRYGLTPQQALQSRRGERPAFPVAADFGACAGKTADILLLERNPLDDIRATRAVHGVVLRGQHLDRAALDALLAKLVTGSVTVTNR